MIKAQKRNSNHDRPQAGKDNNMNEYRVEYSYIRNGKRVSEYDTGFESTAYFAAEAVRDANADLPGIRIEEVWIDRNNRWESVGWDY